MINYKNGLIVVVGFLLLALVYCAGYSVGSHQGSVYNRVYTSGHKSIEKALKSSGVEITNEQLESMYRSVKNDK